MSSIWPCKSLQGSNSSPIFKNFKREIFPCCNPKTTRRHPKLSESLRSLPSEFAYKEGTGSWKDFGNSWVTVCRKKAEVSSNTILICAEVSSKKDMCTHPGSFEDVYCVWASCK